MKWHEFKRWIKNPSLIRRSIRFWWQRRTRGWDDSETWSLDYSLPKVILPRLKRFRDLTIGTPGELSPDDWNNMLDKMIAAFEFYGSDEHWNAPSEEWKKHHEGIKLFAEWYGALWW